MDAVGAAGCFLGVGEGESGEGEEGEEVGEGGKEVHRWRCCVVDSGVFVMEQLGGLGLVDLRLLGSAIQCSTCGMLRDYEQSLE